MMRTLWTVALAPVLFGFVAAGCGSGQPAASPAGQAAAPPNAANSAPATAGGPIDVCGVITTADAATILGPLSGEPPVKTNNGGFGIRDCLYIGPVSGAGANVHFNRLTIQAGSGKDVPDLMQADADRQKATIDVASVGDAAKRNAGGSFVWAKRGEVYCTAEISNGLPNGLTPDTAASRLAAFCSRILAAAK